MCRGGGEGSLVGKRGVELEIQRQRSFSERTWTLEVVSENEGKGRSDSFVDRITCVTESLNVK